MRTNLVLLLLGGILLAAPLASAHQTMQTADGKYYVTFGFLNEPAVTWTKTGLDIIIKEVATNNGTVDGVEKTLNASLIYSDQSQTMPLSTQFGTHGRYTSTVTMTRPGLYKLHVTGKINDTVVDLIIPAKDDTPDINDTYFPDHPGDLNSLQAQVSALQAQVNQLTAQLAAKSATPATVIGQTPGGSTPSGTTPDAAKPAPGFEVGLLALAAVAAVLLVRRRK